MLSGPDGSRSDASGTRKDVYLDYNASAPLDPRVAAVMVPALIERLGNASSTHSFGQRQAAAVDGARQAVAALVGSSPSGVVFTSSATEANNLALRGAVDAAPSHRSRILVSAVEHASVWRTSPAQSGHKFVDTRSVEMSDELCELLAVVALGTLDPDDEGIEDPSRIIEIANQYAAAGCEELLLRLRDPDLRLSTLDKAINFATELTLAAQEEEALS